MKNARVLIVEDDLPSLDILKRVLVQRGHLAATAGSAEAARVQLERGTFDLVLLDHVLPGRTGAQVLREFSALTEAPIYIMSGYVDEDFEKDALLLGASGFLSKPLDLAAVDAAVEALPG